jgi:glycosyltransferase involved in cell wall biosynthesis
MPEEHGISVCIVCRNEADRLEPCLESVAWADEIIVMDLDSSDGSPDVARAHGAAVVTRAPLPIVEPFRNELADMATGEWILAMDPDERVSPGLARELRVLSERPDVDIVEIPFMHRDFGFAPSHRLHRYDPKPRMYRRAAIKWPTEPNKLPAFEEERLYRLPLEDGYVMYHDRNRSIPEALDRVMRYAPAEAQAMLDRGEVFTARAMLRTLGGKARKQFVTGDPWADGVPGFVRAGVLVAYHFYVWACFWQLSGAKRTPEDDAVLRRVGAPLLAAKRTYRILAAPLAATRHMTRRR